MISVHTIEERLFDFFDTVFGSEKTLFGFPSAASSSYLVDRQTTAPRVSASSLLYYRVENITMLGNAVSGDRSYIDRTTGHEFIDIWRQAHVVVNVLTKRKGDAIGAMNFISAANQSTRHYEACYNTGSFDLALHNVNRDFRNLTALENQAWTERVEADFYFNYKDTIELTETNEFIGVPSTVYATKDKVNFEIDLI